MVTRLRDKGWPDIVANSVVGQLLELQIIDDRRFARDWVRYRDRLRPSGEWLLRHELEEKGLDKRIVDDSLAMRQTPEWFEEIGLRWDGRKIDALLCEQVVAARSRRMTDIDEEKRRSRLVGLLARRGFQPGDIFPTLRLPSPE